MASLSIRLTEELERGLAAEAQRVRTSRSELAREAIADYLRRRERDRFMAELVEEARQLKGDPEIRRLTDEQLPIDNEAMEIAEGGPADATEAEPEERWWR